MAVKRNSAVKSKAAEGTPSKPLEVPASKKARSSSTRSTSPRTSTNVKHSAVEAQTAATAVATLAQSVASGVVTASQEEIARLAYYYWEQRGCPQGDSMQDWLRAERDVLTQYQAQTA